MSESDFERESTASISSASSDGSEDNFLSDVEPHELHSKQSGNHDIHFKVPSISWSMSYKIRKLFIHGSFYIIGLCILIGGGVSSRFHPHVDPEEYSNCTDFDNSSYASGDMSL